MSDESTPTSDHEESVAEQPDDVGQPAEGLVNPAVPDGGDFTTVPTETETGPDDDEVQAKPKEMDV